MMIMFSLKNVMVKKRQEWHFDYDKDKITNVDSKKCLDLNTSNNDIGTWKCRGAVNQQITIDNDEIRVLYFDNDWCLTRAFNDNIFASRCEGETRQKFTVIDV